MVDHSSTFTFASMATAITELGDQFQPIGSTTMQVDGCESLPTSPDSHTMETDEFPGDEDSTEYRPPCDDKQLCKYAPATKKRKRTPTNSYDLRNSEAAVPRQAKSSAASALPPAMPRKASIGSPAPFQPPTSTRKSIDNLPATTVETPTHHHHHHRSHESNHKHALDPLSIPLPARGQPIPSDLLVTLTAAGFDSWLARLTASRELTPEEDATMKMIRRRIRNRESARDSRSNKKNYLQTLQQRVDGLKLQNHKLHMQMSSLRSENKALRDEATYLQNMIRSTPGSY